MSDLLQKLRDSVDDRYRVHGEVGWGGMAVVFKATDTRHGRTVAIKVLRPEVAAFVGGERFVREISVAANLAHPNILPLHDSGELDGLAYYVMPFIEGESLAERLAREGPLPVSQAVSLARQLASALHYAHEHGVVHRDLKPANVLLAGGQPLLADFGIARALGDTQGQGVTATGMALGTPAYMSPEQWSADADIDGRSDLYSLGCLLYAMLEGAPPFSGSVHSIMAGHLTADVDGLTSKRRDVPPAVMEVIRRCLEKDPARRFQTGQEFIEALDTGLEPTIFEKGLRVSRRALRRSPQVRLVLLVGVALAGYMVWLAGFSGSSAPAELDDDLVAVLPFRVTGAGADPDVGVTLADLLSQRMPGDFGPRALPPSEASATLGADRVRDGVTDADGAEAARALGAGHFVVGQVSVAGTTVNIASRLVPTDGGAESPMVSVQGDLGRLPALADELSVRLLAARAGIRAYRVPSLLRANPTAVRAYVAGRALRDRGAYGAAAARFNDALDADSTFALAGVDLLSLNLLSEGARDMAFRAFRLAPQAAQTLDPRDQTLLTALVAPDFSNVLEQRAAWEAVIQARPDEPEPYMYLGFLLHSSGNLIGVEGALRDARAALTRATQLDPSLLWPWMLLLDIAAAERDVSGAARAQDRLEALDAQVEDEVESYYRWRAALVRSDTAVLDSLRARLGDTPFLALRQLVGEAQIDGLGLSDAPAAVAALRAAAAREREVTEADLLLRALALNRGRPGEAARVPWDPELYSWNELHQIMYGLYWDADPEQASEAAEWAREQDPLSEPDGAVNHHTACALGLWEAHHGSRAAVEQLARKLRTIPNNGQLIGGANAWACAAILDAEMAVREGRPDALATVEALDRLVQPGPNMYGSVIHLANLVAGRLLGRLGEAERGLAAVRRRHRNAVRGVQFLAPMVLEEARLAEQVGDVDGALAAYRHFLALQADAEPALQPRLEEVRAAVARLEAGA